MNKGDRVCYSGGVIGTVVRPGEEVSEVKWDDGQGMPAWSYVPNDKLKEAKEK